MTMGPAPMIMMDLMSVLFGMGGPRICEPGGAAPGSGFVNVAQIGEGLGEPAGRRNPDPKGRVQAGRA